MERKDHGGIPAFVLKTVAIIGMTLDHAGNIFYAYLPIEAVSLLFAFGGLTFPIMAFLIGEGYRHTSNFRNYALRLLAFALVAQIPYSLFLFDQGNVLFTLLFGLLVIYVYERWENKAPFIVAFIAALLVGMFLDWGLMGIPMIFLYYRLKNRGLKAFIPWLIPMLFFLPEGLSFASTMNVNLLPTVLYVLVGCTLTIPLIYSYNGKRGKPLKYFFYIYYPLHIAILGIGRHMLFGG